MDRVDGLAAKSVMGPKLSLWFKTAFLKEEEPDAPLYGQRIHQGEHR